MDLLDGVVRECGAARAAEDRGAGTLRARKEYRESSASVYQIAGGPCMVMPTAPLIGTQYNINILCTPHCRFHCLMIPCHTFLNFLLVLAFGAKVCRCLKSGKG